MTDVISTRMKKEEVEELNRISADEHMDRSALMRKFLLQQIKQYRLKDVSEKYRKGMVSMAEAATLAKVSIYEMMEYCRKEQIRPVDPEQSEWNDEFSNAKEIFLKIKKS